MAVHRQQVGRFILATNSLDSEKWTESEILREYKGQQSTERGFRFLKAPLYLFFQHCSQKYETDQGFGDDHVSCSQGL